MDFVDLGKTGEKLPALGMGTWKLDRRRGAEALKAGLSLGSRFIDTAEMYGTEDLVGEAIRGEEGVFVATKVSPHNLRHDDVLKACSRSLKLLGVKAIDLYQVHWPNPSIPISETMSAMEELVAEGKVRYIGVSNFSAGELKAAQEALKREEIVSNQVEYSVTARDPENNGLADYCRSSKVTIIAYSPFGSGGLYSRKRVFDGLEKIGARHGKTGSQVALNWLLSKGNVSAIPKANSVEHIRENLGSVGWKLDRKDIEAIDSFLGRSPLVGGLNSFILKRSSGLWSRHLTNKYLKEKGVVIGKGKGIEKDL